jgi:hypothetical protein
MTLEHFHLLWSVSGAKKKPLESVPMGLRPAKADENHIFDPATDRDGQCLILPCSRKAPAIVWLPFPARPEGVRTRCVQSLACSEPCEWLAQP